MNRFSDFLERTYVGNTIEDYLWVVGSLLVGTVFLRFFAKRISNLIFNLTVKKAPGVDKEKLYGLIAKPLKWLIALVLLLLCTSHLEFPEEWDMTPKEEFGIAMVLSRGYLTLMAIVVTWVALRLIDFAGVILYAKAQLTESKADDQVIPFLIEIIKIIGVTIGIFFTLGAVFKVDIGALIAGLGIGGLALALAAKESLENLLASFVIFFDKPFVIGDLVKVNNIEGTVEKIGFRSTRIRTLEKSYLTLPNRQMIDNTLDNLSLRTFRRVSFNIGLLYGTTEAQLKGIVKEIQEHIDQHPHTNQEGEIHFTEFAESSLNVMILYYIDTMDWRSYLNIKEEINFTIMAIVKKHGADFAFPTQTVYLEKKEQ